MAALNIPFFLTAMAALTAIVCLALAAEQGLQGRKFAALGFSLVSAVSVFLLTVILRWWKDIEPATFAAAFSALGVS